MSSHRGMPVGAVTVAAVLLGKPYGKNAVLVACFLGIALYRFLNIRVKSVAHYSEGTNDLCIGVLFSYCLDKLGVGEGVFLLKLLVVLGIAVIIGA